ncbi:hypothetical protein LOC68_14275 [Blastopirellula sp. JC732]|uniref:Uncharacterized protein n=1 Tax=Blastopirellula sediminis TaxID=2894196 RepID=A0A9X1MMJ8_9BACT|nr:hypothetical protein [Blastopirellula sediminis]MCC9607151.1 hypothetical protein [Blastopirellula sediminis]MCC9629556.1 hypothetical protein [Blastopirellula sediminis]
MRSHRFIATSLALSLAFLGTSSLFAQFPFGGSSQSGGLFGGSSSNRYRGEGNYPPSNNNSNLETEIVKGIFGALNEGIKAGNQGNNNNNWRPEYNRPRPQYYPQPQYYPTPTPTPAPATPKNVAPKKNPAPVKKVAAKKNNVMNTSKFLSLTSQDIDRANEKLKDQQDEKLDDIEDQLAGQLPPSDTDLVTQLGNAGIADPTVQQQILDAKNRGDAATVQILYNANAMPPNPGAAADLANKINLQNDLNDLRQQNQDGKLRPRDIDRFVDKTKNIFPPGAQRDDYLANLDDMKKTAEVQDLLAGATPNPGMGGLGGGTVTVIHNPNLPQGTVINLGNGSVMVGTGGQGDLNVGTSSLAEAMGLPVAYSEPVPESDATIPTSGVVLRNGADNEAEISYVINDKYEYTMKAGHIQSLGEGKWVVRFDRGDTYGEAKYTLTDGTYEFTPSDSGWALFTKKYDVTIDNSENPNEFNYVVNNVPAVIEPYGTKTHNSKYPLEVRFDRGDGKGEERKVLDGGTFMVAVSPQDNLWDLYSTDGSSVLPGGGGGGINLFGN